MIKFDSKYYDYLYGLRESGVTNMFGAGMYLESDFPELDRNKARDILSDWMRTFPRKEETNAQSGAAES